MFEYKVSVIIPIYNSENTLLKCLNSVFNQTLDDVQMVLIDDGSKDKSYDIISRYVGQKNIISVHQKNMGVSAARNRGIDISKGEYLFFLDSDDYLEPDVLEKLWKYGKKYNLDLVSCSHTEFNATLYNGNNSNLDTFVAMNNREIGKHFIDVFPKSACAKLFRRELIEKNKIRFPEEMRLGEDMYFSYSFILELNSMGKVADAFYRIQNVNPLSLSKRFVPNIEQDIVKQIGLWKRIIEKYPFAEKAYYTENMDIELSLSAGFFNNLYKSDCPLSNIEKRKSIYFYLKKHKKWISEGGKGEKRPKNRLQKITYIVLKTRSPFIISAFFRIKECVKKKKFEGGRAELK